MRLEALSYAEAVGGHYCEGLIMSPELTSPERSIWVESRGKATLFLHEAADTMSLIGMPFCREQLKKIDPHLEGRKFIVFSEAGLAITRPSALS